MIIVLVGGNFIMMILVVAGGNILLTNIDPIDSFTTHFD